MSMARPRGGRIKGSATVGIQVTGVSGIRRALAPWLEPELTRELDAANRAAARVLAKELRAEVKPLSKRMAKAVRVKRARTGKPGWVVGAKRKTAFFWHMVIRGTRDHGPRKAKALIWTAGGRTIVARRVRGVRGVPVIERVAQRAERRAAAGIDAHMTRATGT
jgi:hypothetical protein